LVELLKDTMNQYQQAIESANRAHHEAIARAVMNSVRDALLSETASSISVGSLAGDYLVPLPPLAKTIAPSGSLKRKAKGGKRSAEDLATLTAKLGGFIAKNPGQRIEQIGKSLGVSTRELALPAKKLIASGAVKTRGQKRATVYVPAAKGAR
jgi:hypothetical protein